jgi:hypothetical protein
MRVSKLVTGDLSVGEDIGWGNAMLVWKVVVDMSSIVYRHRPERAVNPFFPSHQRMEKHGSCHIGYCQNNALWKPILMVGVDPTLLDLLIMLSKVSNKLICLERAVVGKIISDNDSITKCKLFVVVLFSTNCLRGREPKLMLNMHIYAGLVHQDAFKLFSHMTYKYAHAIVN